MKNPANQSTAASQQLRVQVVEHLFRNGLTNLIAVLVSVFTITTSIYLVNPVLMQPAWILVVMLFSSARFLHISWFNRHKNNHEWHFRLFMAGVFCSGLIWGYAATFLVPFQFFELKMLIILFIGAMAAGSAVTLAPVYSSFLLFNLTLFPFLVFGSLGEGSIGQAISLQAALFLVILLAFGYHLHRSFITTLLMEAENLSLIDELQEQKDKLQQLNALLEQRVELSGSALAAANSILEREVEDKELIEQDLLENQDMLDAAFDFAPTAMSLVNSDGIIFNVNRAACEMSGWVRDELTEKSILEVTHEDFRSSGLAMHKALFSGKIDGYNMESKFLKKGGDWMWIDLRVSIVRNRKGEPLYKIAHIIDIDEKKKAELELIKSNKQFQQAIQVAGLGYWEWDYTICRMTYCNREYAELFEMTVDEMMQKCTSDEGTLEMIHPDDREYFTVVEADANAKQEALEFEYRIVTKSGKIRLVQEISDISLNENGEITGAFGVLRQIVQPELQKVS